MEAEKYIAGARKVAQETGNLEKTVEGVMARVERQTGAAASKYALFGDESKLLASKSKILESAMNRLTTLGFDAQSTEVKLLKSEYDKLHPAIDKTTESAGKTQGAFASMRDAMQGPVAVAKDVIQAVKAIIGVATELYNSFAEAERAGIVFDQALKDSGTMAQDASGRLRGYAEQLQQTTQFEADNTLAIMGNLAAQGKSEKQIAALIEAASNLASATGVDLDTAVKQLNSTLSGNVGLLGRQNVAIKALTKEQLMNGEAIAIINKQYEGMAEALGTSAFGASEKLKNNVDDLKEALGEIVSWNFKPLVENMANAAAEAAARIRSETIREKVLAGERLAAGALAPAIQSLAAEKKRLQELPLLEAFALALGDNSVEDQIARLDKALQLLQTQALAAGVKASEELAAQQVEAAKQAAKAAQELAAQQAEAAKQAAQELAAQQAEAAKQAAQELAAQQAEAAKQAAKAAADAAAEEYRLYLVRLEANFGRISREFIDPMAEDQAARTARLSRQFLGGVDPMAEDYARKVDALRVLGTTYRVVSNSAEEAAFVVAKADKQIMEKTAELVGANATQLENLAEAQKQVASLLGTGMVASFNALGQALANGESGWEAWAKAGVNAIAGVLEQWAAATAVMGFAELFNPLTAASGAAKILAAAGAATAAGVMRGSSATVSATTAAPVGTQVTNIYVEGSVITERQLARVAGSYSERSGRGW
jgi:hypothetical protein